MKYILIFFLIILGINAESQTNIATIKCYNNKTFKEQDCVSCGFKANTFSGVIVRYMGRDYPFQNPIRIKVVGANVTFEDAFNAPTLTIPIAIISGYNTLNKLTTFITDCKCGDCTSGGGGGGTDKFISSYTKSGNNLILNYNDATSLTIVGIYNKETIYLNGVLDPNATAPTNDLNNRALAVGDKYTNTATGELYRYNGTTWDLIYTPVSNTILIEHFTLNASGQVTLSLITGFNTFAMNTENYIVELEGQELSLNRSDFSYVGQTLTFSGGATNAGQRGSVRKLK